MGAKYYWYVDVESSPGSNNFIYVPNVQAVNFNYGRTQPTDDFPAGQLTLSGILPASLPTALTQTKSLVRVQMLNNAGTLKLTRYFYARSLTRTYGTQPNLDTWNFTAVGSLALLGEQQLTSDYTLTAGATTTNSIQNLLSFYSISSSAQTGLSFVSGTTFPTGTYANDVVQQLIRTEQGRLTDSISTSVEVTNRSGVVTATTYTYFNDGTVSAPSVTPYMSVEFLNDGAYLANTVIVEPEGLADQVVGSTKPVLNFDTLDQTTAQAGNLAQYIKNTLDLNTVRPSTVTFNADAQTNETFLAALTPGTQVRIDLRGVSYSCVVEGVSVVANPSTTEVSLNVSSATAYQFLRLDDAVFGTLDSNRLGF